jgi:c-di-GMP-related signal transduction protein
VQQAEDEWLLASAIDLAFQRALGDKLTFLGVAAETLHSPLMEQLPKDKVVSPCIPNALFAGTDRARRTTGA